MKKDDGKLGGVVMLINKSRFDDLADSLQKKYTVLSSKRPRVGDAHVYMLDGNTAIDLDAPHLSFEMTLLYIEKDIKDAIENQSQQDAQQKKQAEEDLL